MIIIHYPQPDCVLCGNPMDSWNPWIPPEKQSHAECRAAKDAEEVVATFRRSLHPETTREGE